MDTNLPSKRIKYSSATESTDNRIDLIFSGDSQIRDYCQSSALPAQSKWKVQVFSLLARLKLALLLGSRTVLFRLHVQPSRANYMPDNGSDLFVPPLPRQV